ncbi:CDP-diacylglycerol--serine O-phosphatidyltransferase [Tabrizicola piscis]|uniref:CDP-diacylglycerol--serine O-phosphatidyltransferase n=1 Tax=Tabrizicola piscis TaxID=2494374 RepID=A0A3S8U374_9RHOB|nr:CDP-diacylglycerol--serine O-phosphatidyltransferase [Tabrizicola piscis]AZL58064.1 CDP-diacylglycerol--serine O-phosphatidyltransferase [Tabrizicola piscis]
MGRRPSEAPRELLVLKLLPNLVSILALCAGLTAIRFAIAGNFAMAILLIGTAAALDGLDGRLARMLKSESAIGAELDSLCDFVNFGVTPALVLYLWGLRPETSLGWIAVLVYAVCCMLRLARFNVGNRAVGEPAEKTVFIGVPSPAGAMLALAPMYLAFALSDALGGIVPLPPVLVALWMVGIGALMISRVRTPSLKRITIATDYARYALVGSVMVVAALLTYPWVTLLALSLGYLAAILVIFLRSIRAGTSI